jgi:Flp pilus assembly protein TadG
MKRVAKLATALRSVRQSGRGIAAAEFALIAPVMILLLFGLYDIGNAIQDRMQLQQALRAGGQFALSFPDQTTGTLSTTGFPSIQSTVMAALPSNLASNVTVTALPPACYCWNSTDTTVGTSTPCADGCPQGDTKRSFVTLTATNNTTPLFFQAVAGNSASYVVQVQ